MTKKIRVTILDDHQLTLDGYLYRLGQTSDIEVAATLSFGEELESSLEKTATDVLILDVGVRTSPDSYNPYPILYVIPKLLNLYPRLAILIISMFADQALIQSLVEAGASGYILKDDQETLQRLGKIVIAVANGGNYFSPVARKFILKHHGATDTNRLTARQLEALSLYAAYEASETKEIAQKMSVSLSTFRNHLAQASAKLGVHSRSAAVARARELGLITPNSPAVPLQRDLPQ